MRKNCLYVVIVDALKLEVAYEKSWDLIFRFFARLRRMAGYRTWRVSKKLNDARLNGAYRSP
jgi:hypothetical protein